MVLSHKYKFMFFCNGKTGTTSIENVLRPYQEGELYDISSPGLFYKKHVPPTFLKACLPRNIWTTYFKFVFVRNPWDWVVSNWKYNYELLPSQRRAEHSLFRKIRNYFGGYGWAYKQESRDKLTVDDIKRLHKYLEPVRGVPYAASICQSPYVFDPDGKQLVDFVGRFENIEKDFSYICQRIGLNLRLPTLNATSRRPYQDYYDTEARDLVSKLWAQDIANFGYSFSPSTSS